MIDILDHLIVPRDKKIENKSFEETKEELEDLCKHHAVFDELENSNIFEAENSMHIKNDVFIQATLLISEIKEKQEITGKLNSLSYSIGWLRAATIIKDNNIINKAIKSIISNEYSSINAIIPELNSLKDNIDKFEKLHTSILNNDLFSLDAKIILEQDFRKKHKKLNNLYHKQKNILFNLSNIFIKLTKGSVLKNKK